ncbi:flagellar hook protein FlgE [Parasedimentitalea psychrophila]|uniref:Flagellar hook protein FlgE n=1 Tax=Parasedimentitalea psychrophila TaxID=2997337 RepID=A0A9Y2P2L2_9RHOB|nr:flagellar hook-basal body complex protein [Parasedimentitalea psychrophila]WIY26776.1 flagellar hook-basal body complex protein [Parasedimentitalea psychrophila]
MTLSSSLNAGVAGLSANASRLASISDNIANSSTAGYKRVQTDFHSMVISTNGGTYTAGGVATTTTRMIDERGSLISTSNSTDLAVRGRGMLPVASLTDVEADNVGLNMMLTTTGSFSTNADGMLTTETGLVLLGWPALPDGTIPSYSRGSSSSLEAIQFNTTQLTGEPTTSVDLGVNLPAASTISGAAGDIENLPIEYYDNLGNSENIQVEFTPTVPGAGSSNEWTMVLTDSASGGAVIGEYTLTFTDSRTAGGALASVAMVSGGAYDAATGSVIVNVAGGPIEVNVGELGSSAGLTQLADDFNMSGVTKDGSPVGTFTGVEVGIDGMVTASYDNGATRVVYQVPLVDMANPNGMIALDSQTYMPSDTSGAIYLWDAGDGPTGDVVGYAREESTTDVATELTNMIQTQRAYSSSAKIIQTVDEMLQETTNIKR